MKKIIGVALVPLFLAVVWCASAGQAQQPEKDTILLTIFLKHDQSKTLDEIQAHLKKSGFSQNFPPEGVEVVSWYVMMGLGQVVTLRVPPAKLREVNLAIERGAWGAFRTEFYPTYDYQPIWREERHKTPGK
ncbi:MAG: hypothetical protein WC443_07360 [Desulfobaccales bacterium]